MQNIGLIIKQSRQKKEMKQLTLAKGICSVSYLSKLENNKIEPSEEILSALLNRLSLTIKTVDDEEELSILNKVKAVYKKAIIDRNKKLIAKEVLDIEKKNIVFNNPLYAVDFLLLLIRLHLITGRGSTKIHSLLDYIELQETDLTTYQKCLLNTNKAIFLFNQENYPETVHYIEKALDYQQVIVMEKWELADLYNVLALCYLVNNHNYSAIEFARKSLNIYRDLLLFNRAIDCYITIGISYKRNYKYKESEENFKAAQLLSDDRGLKEFEGIINQNLGTLFAIQGHSEKAIMYFFTSLKNQKTTEGYLITIFSLIKEYSKLESAQNVKKWCRKGYALQASEGDQYISYMYHFKIFEALHLKSSELKSTLIKAIKYFETKEDYRHVHKYAILLAKNYYNDKQLKNAGIYFSIAHEAMLLSKKLLKWEDL